MVHWKGIVYGKKVRWTMNTFFGGEDRTIRYAASTPDGRNRRQEYMLIKKSSGDLASPPQRTNSYVAVVSRSDQLQGDLGLG